MVLSATAQNLVLNGGFEDPDIADWAGYAPGDTGLTSWTIDATPGDGVQLLEGAWATGGAVPSQFVMMMGGVTYADGGSISQTIATTPSTAYLISVDVFTRNQPASGVLTFDGTELAFSTSSYNSPETLSWVEVATGSSTVISIRSDALVSGQELLSIDNVSVVIPEPSTLALLGLGSALLLTRRRLR